MAKNCLTGFGYLSDHKNMISRWLLHLCFALALLFAQQGAALHALSHLGENLPAQSEQEKHLPHSPACDKCVVYAGVGSAAAATPFVFIPQPAVFVLAATLFALFFSAPYRPYLSRAPPRLA